MIHVYNLALLQPLVTFVAQNDTQWFMAWKSLPNAFEIIQVFTIDGREKTSHIYMRLVDLDDIGFCYLASQFIGGFVCNLNSFCQHDFELLITYQLNKYKWFQFGRLCRKVPISFVSVYRLEAYGKQYSGFKYMLWITCDYLFFHNTWIHPDFNTVPGKSLVRLSKIPQIVHTVLCAMPN